MIVVAWVLLILAGLAIVAYAYWVVLLSIYPEPIIADEVHTVTTPDLWKVRLFHLKGSKAGGEPVLMVHGASMNRLLYFSPRGDSLGERLAEQGYDVWAVDLRGRRSSEPPFGRKRNSATFEEYLHQDLPAVMAYIFKETGRDQVHWVGHSMGGMLAYAYERLHGGDALASVVTLGSPMTFHASRYTPPGFAMQLAMRAPVVAEVLLRAIAPVARYTPFGATVLPMHWEDLREGVRASFFFNAFEISPPPVTRAMLQWADAEQWRVHDESGQEVDLQTGPAMKTPLLAIYGAGDRMIDADDAAAWAKKRAGAAECKVLSRGNGQQADYGHLDLVIGKHAVEEVFAPLTDWIQGHPATKPAAAKASRGDEKPAANDTADKTSDAETPSAEKPKTRKKSSGTKKTAAKKKTSTKKPAAKKKTSAKKKSSTKKKPATKKKTATKKKPAAKKKASARKKPAAKKKTSSDD